MTTAALVRALLFTLTFATFCAHRSFACSCMSGSSAQIVGHCSDLKPIGPSFVGTVIDIENPPDEQRAADQSGVSRYRFRVDENINGFEDKEIDVYSGRGRADCSYHFRMGESYFVTPYKATASLTAHYGTKPGAWMAGVCQTQPAASAAALLADFKARKRGSTVEGILRTKQPPSEYDHGMPNITVELRGKDSTLSTQTDVDGMYRFTAVPPGDYQVAVKLPPDFPRLPNIPGENPSSITIADQTCYAKDIDALRAARIAP
jgi:hypothetical protein